MMRVSGRHQLFGAAMLLAMVSLAGWGAWEGYQSLRAQSLRDRLLYVKTQDAPAVIQSIEPHRARVRPLLVASLVIAAIVTVIVVTDGESTWLEGATLVVLYALLASAFWWG